MGTDSNEIKNSTTLTDVRDALDSLCSKLACERSHIEQLLVGDELEVLLGIESRCTDVTCEEKMVARRSLLMRLEEQNKYAADLLRVRVLVESLMTKLQRLYTQE